MLIRIIVAALVVLLAGGVAQAASFDCAKAATDIETAICSDPQLSTADETLATAYATAVGGLSKAASEAMRQNQHGWLDFVAADCADDALPGEEAKETERVACLTNLYTARITLLENSRMLGGLRFFTHDRYAVFPDPEGESYSRMATKLVSYPQIDGSAAGASAFNAFAQDEADALSDGFFPARGKKASGDAVTSDDEAILKVGDINDARITLDVSTYFYGHGAAHGMYTVEYRHFLRKEGRALEAGDIFAGKNWQNHLKKLVVAKLKADLADNYQAPDDDLLTQSITDPTRWNFTDNGLVVQFQPYDVAAYAVGAVAVTIPWQALDSDLAESAYEIAVY